ncbi:hypothetical protein C4K38_2151 [Pseudomonas chlororaphis subsp. piscium]|uniref:phage tail tip fiber protein n=1 Tax=Pseudomonas chlororaphis TaxID=587753 RepID=UPI0006A608E7|nr:hypothetical protein [Pseudomonas chlororaphis]AZC30111.1 hypothetical protein C4K38_2151 [Pseudomonas chlororaphis subsp. piscium]WDG94044.1 hypothetical protein PUP49_11660 [Pseudomonas chlororaphis]SDT24644.1 hypothetical protein SAMN05216585_5225 [Pseudomonas chlororaphis]
MQSPDFVEGVSGWRLSKDRLELYGMASPVILGNLDAPESRSATDQPKPFIVIDGVTYISQAEIERASITNAKIVAGLAEPIRRGCFCSGGYTGDGPENGSGIIASGADRLSDTWVVKMASTPSGERYVAGFGGFDSQFLVDADRWKINDSAGDAPQPGDALKAGGVGSMLDAMASTISETSLGKELLSEISKVPTIADQIRDVLRAELKPGGMLHLR